MRRNILSAAARPSRALAGLNNYPRRTFTSTIAAQEQAHPIGPFYEAILRSPPFIPETKPEAAPVSSAPEVVAELPARPKPTPTTPAPAPAAEQPKPEPAKAEQPPAPAPKKEEAVPETTTTTPSKPAAAPKSRKAPAAPKEAEPVKETPAKRTRASSKKAKSVAPDSPSSSSSLSSPSTLSSSSSSVLPSTTSREQSPNPLKHQSNDPSQASSSSNSREGESDSHPESDTPESRARVIFSSSLVGPAERAERLAAIKSQSRLVAGVLVPPKPEEPDNCCMSGCVNCVWERYRDELEEWASASAEAERRLMAREASSTTSTSDIEEEGLLEEGKGAIESVDASMAAADRNGGTEEQEEAIPAVGSMDDDGGGSETNWTAPTVGKKKEKATKEFWNEELYKNVPVGIREFMKQEKRLKEKHLREGTLGG